MAFDIAIIFPRALIKCPYTEALKWKLKWLSGFLGGMVLGLFLSRGLLRSHMKVETSK